MYSRPRPQLCWLFGLVAALLAASLAAACLVPQAGWLSIVVLSFAMGIMNNTITRVGGQSVSLGYVTGDLNNLGQHLVLSRSSACRCPTPKVHGIAMGCGLPSSQAYGVHSW